MRLAVVGIIAGGAALPGCAQIAGIDVTSAADHSNVTLAFSRVSIGATVVTAPQDLTAEMATYLVDSDADPTGFQRVPATLANGSTSTWTAKIADGAPQALFTLPDDTTNLYDLGRDVLGDFVAYEHPGATAAASDAMVASTLAIPAWNGDDAFELYIVGTWASHGLPAPTLPGDTAIPAAAFLYDSFAVEAGAKPLAAVTDADAVLALAHSPSGTLVGVYDQSGLPSDAVTGTIAPVAADTTAMASIDQAALDARLGAAAPAGDAPTVAWEVTAAPGAKVGDARGPRLDAGAVVSVAGTITSTFGNPFATTRMWPAVFGVTASSARTYMMTTTSTQGSVAVPLASSVSELTLASAPDAALDAPLATGVTLAGTSLASDGATVTVDPAKPVALAFSPGTGSTPVMYGVLLDELVPSPDGMLVDTVPVLTALSLAPAFRLPPEKLVAGHTYVVHVTCFVGGYPGAVVGNLQQRALPVTAATLAAGVFTVAAP